MYPIFRLGDSRTAVTVSTLATLTDNTDVMKAAYELYVTNANRRQTISKTLADGFKGVLELPENKLLKFIKGSIVSLPSHDISMQEWCSCVNNILLSCIVHWSTQLISS